MTTRIADVLPRVHHLLQHPPEGGARRVVPASGGLEPDDLSSGEHGRAATAGRVHETHGPVSQHVHVHEKSR